MTAKRPLDARTEPDSYDMAPNWQEWVAFGLSAILIVACMIVIVGFTAGCATVAKTEFVDADGTNFTAISKAGAFGTLDTTNQKMLYEWGEMTGMIAVGQDAQGLDNSGQIAAIQAAGDVLAPLFDAAVSLIGLPPVGDAPAMNVWLEGLRVLTGGDNVVFSRLLELFIGRNQ